MTYQQALELKDSLTNDFIFLNKNIQRRYFFNIPSNRHRYDSLKDDVYEFVNGIGVIQKEDDSYGLSVYTEGLVPGDSLTDYLGLRGDEIFIDNIGPITIKSQYVKMGDSISSRHGDTGSIGCFVKDVNNIKHMLSNYHVLTNHGTVGVGDEIISPAVRLKGDPRYDVAAHLSYAKKVHYKVEKAEKKNYIDCAVARLINQDISNIALPGGEEINGWSEAKYKMKVLKQGSKTGLTKGKVISTSTNIRVDYGGIDQNKKEAYFYDQIAIKGLPGRPFSEMGDSGALIFENETNKAVGLLFSGSSDGTTFANPIKWVLDALSVEIL